MSDHLWAGQDPRDGRRWLAIRRRFRHTAFGYEDATVLDMVSEAERLFLVEDEEPPPLGEVYLVQAIDRIRSRGPGSSGLSCATSQRRTRSSH